jgi:cell division protein FtsZ
VEIYEETKKPAFSDNIENKPVESQSDLDIREPEPRPAYQEPAQPSHPDINTELEAMLAQQKTRIKVIGCGGAGGNTINRITEVGVKGAQTIAINTDAQDLLYTTSDKKLLVGREVTKGMGAGSNPKLGEEAAKENEIDIKRAIENSDMVFITCGLGGGTGSGCAPVVAQVSKKMGALTVAIVTLPFTMEGYKRQENAQIGLEKLEQVVDTLIVIPNEKLLELAPDLPLQTAFKVADEILTNSVKGIAELVTKAGLVNLDFADIKAVMGSGGVALIGVGESDTEDRANEAVQKAIENPLLDVEVSGASGALINVSGGEDMTLDEARKVVETVGNLLDEDAKIIWGAQIYKDLDRTVRVLLIITGVKSEQIFSPLKRTADKKIQEIEKELGIEFVK